ncbi:MAG: hypothetical protein HC858_02800 [Brachymonas sp.]|nr:hypothetical protein [Brachymonas sp.]
MATSPKAPNGSALDIGVNDLGPLAWVLDELRKSLDSATKALRRYVRDAELAKGSDLNAADASQLRIARQQLHQSVGALEMVGFAAPASMLRGMEGAVQKFVTKPELCTDAATVKVERASFALLGYLESLLAGKSPSAVELFSQYADVQELAGATRIHPADLWTAPWRWLEVQDTGAAVMELDANFRARFDKTALMVVKTADVNACAELSTLSAGLANQTQLPVEQNFRSFWRIAAAVLEAVASGALVADIHVKRTVSRLLIQLATHVKGDLSVPDRLTQDLVFFCAQAISVGGNPRLSEVRLVYGLAKVVPVDYSKSFFGQFDPNMLVQARKRISQLKESWSSFTAGELTKAKPVQDQMSLLIDSIGKLLPTTGQALAAALNEVVDSTARVQRPPEATLGMEVATAILYLEASFEDFDPSDEQQSNRMSHLAQRVQMARGGAASQPLESWMEELYRRVSDRQTMGSVVGELKLTLGELEKLMDAYFRDPQDKVLLADVPGKLTQMRGVLTVLGLDQAGQAVMRMRDSVEQILVTEIDVERARSTGTFDKLGNNLGALGFLIDMLSYQPVLAKKLFVYDEAEGELKPLMGRTVVESAQVEPDTTSVSIPAVAAADSGAALPMTAMQATVAMQAVTPVASSPVPVAAAVIVDAQEVDPELLDIFLEEAREVVGNGLAATQALIAEPNNLGEMTTLRRAFHTLKGSSRMVGLNVFGEAAWSMEQVLNAWLADQKPANADLCNLSTQAMQAHQVWIEEIASGGGKQRSATPFRTSADALRLQGQLIPIVLEQAAPVLGAVSAEEPSLAQLEPVQASVVIEVPALDQPTIELAAAEPSTNEPAVIELPVMDLPSLDLSVAEVPVPAVVSVSVVETADFDLPSFDFAELATPVTSPALSSAVATSAPEPVADKFSVDDFSLHLSDLDGALPAPVLLEPEPFVTIASPEIVSRAAAESTATTEAITPSAAESIEPVVTPVDDLVEFNFEPILQADTPVPVEPNFEVDLQPVPAIPVENILTADPGSEVSLAGDLVTAEELAAFEQAMMAMDTQDASQPNVPAAQLVSSVQGLPDAVQISATDSADLTNVEFAADSISLDASDLEALESMSALLPTSGDTQGGLPLMR